MRREADRRLRLAERIADALTAHATPRAILLVGSVASGDADEFSDLDLISYHDELPTAAALAAAREDLGATSWEPLGGSREDGGFAETWRIDSVDCQIAFHTLAAQERDMAAVLGRHEPATPLHKAMEGLLHGIALFGADVVGEWQRLAAGYPDGLASAVVRHHLRFFPLWYVGDRLARADALLWHYQARVEVLQNVLGVLAGINRLYYSTFQFKRMRRFIASMQHAPTDLAARVEHILTSDPATAGVALESLVADTLDIVEHEMPDIDTAQARRYLSRRQ